MLKSLNSETLRDCRLVLFGKEPDYLGGQQVLSTHVNLRGEGEGGGGGGGGVGLLFIPAAAAAVVEIGCFIAGYVIWGRG